MLLMARQLHFKQPPFSTSQTGLAAASLLLCAFALFMCASHSHKWRRRWRAACYDFLDEDPVIELNNEVMLQTEALHEYQMRNGDESTFSGEQQGASAIWQKNILMGGKCQLPDFSGVIIYDSEGNVVTPAKTPCPLLTWK